MAKTGDVVLCGDVRMIASIATDSNIEKPYNKLSLTVLPLMRHRARKLMQIDALEMKKERPKCTRIIRLIYLGRSFIHLGRINEHHFSDPDGTSKATLLCIIFHKMVIERNRLELG